MLIPETLLICIKNELGLECFPVLVKPVSKKHLGTIQNILSKLSPEARKEMYRKRGLKISQALQKKTLAERRAMTANATIASKRLYHDPETRPKRVATARRVVKKWTEDRRARKKALIKEEEVPRINDYAGVITSSQMEELLEEA